MSAADDARAVAAKILEASRRREAAVFALAKAYSGEVLDYFHKRQPYAQGETGEYWTNQTSEAVKAVFSEAFQQSDAIGFFLAHGKEYGVYLELANDRQNEMLRPIIEEFGHRYLVKAKEILGGR